MEVSPTDINESDVRFLRQREPAAVERWFIEHADALYTFVFYRVGRNEELACDVVQETFVTALGKIERYDPDRGTMRAWLTYTARNCIRKALRHGRHCAFWEEIDEKLLAAYERIATSPLPEEAVSCRETAELVRTTLSSIPGNYRDVLARHYWRDEPIKEIARALGTTEGAIKSLLHRARLAFKTAFLTLSESLREEYSATGRSR